MHILHLLNLMKNKDKFKKYVIKIIRNRKLSYNLNNLLRFKIRRNKF